MADNIDIHTLKNALKKPVALVGMMGAGKSFWGKALSEELGLPFYDSDAVIEEKAGISIPRIFEEYGEARFREFETRVIQELCANEPCILATGGGAMMNESGRKALLENAYTVWLDADVETLWSRLEGCKSRPLLQTENPKEKLETLLKERRPFYGQAHMRFRNTKKNQAKALEGLIKTLSEHVLADNL